MDTIIEPGIYRHFKGNYYRVIGEVLDCDTMIVKVLYCSTAENYYYCRNIDDWVKPAQDSAGNVVERYTRISG